MRIQELVQSVEHLSAVIERGADICVSEFAPLSTARLEHITFLNSTKYLSDAIASQASALVLSPTAWQEFGNQLTTPCIIVTQNPYAFFAYASQVLVKAKKPKVPSHISPLANIDLTAQIGDRVSLGAFCHIGKNVQIAADVTIHPHCYIGDDVVIGEHTIVYPNVIIYSDTAIGQQCIIHSGSVIGADGFGFANHQKKWIKIPQTGNVQIGDDVEIGANCAIDRGALGNTVIGRGTKLDNLIQIAHNVQLGEDCAIAAGCAIAGSAQIGNRLQMGGKSGILGHLTICDDVVVSSFTLITKTIRKAGFYTGVYPFEENSDWEKNAVALKRLSILREQVKHIDKRTTA